MNRAGDVSGPVSESSEKRHDSFFGHESWSETGGERIYSQILTAGVNQEHLINRQPPAGFFWRTEKKRTQEVIPVKYTTVFTVKIQ